MSERRSLGTLFVVKRRDGLVRVVEAAYAEPHSGPKRWLEGVCAALEQVHPGPWCAYTIDGGAFGNFVGPFPLATSRIRKVGQRVPEAFLRAAHAPSPPVSSARARWSRVARSFRTTLEEIEALQGYPIPDVTAILGCDSLGAGAACFIHDTKPIPARRTHTLSLVSAHLASAHRLRTALAQGDVRAEAVCSTDGKLLDGTSEAIAARGMLARAVQRIDRARGSMRRLAPDEALASWQAMVDGQWTLVDRVESDGKRFIVAHRNEVANAPAALRGWEAQVATLAALGHSDKFIGYELGLARSTVASHLRRALTKLKIDDRGELIRFFGPLARA